MFVLQFPEFFWVPPFGVASEPKIPWFRTSLSLEGHARIVTGDQEYQDLLSHEAVQSPLFHPKRWLKALFPSIVLGFSHFSIGCCFFAAQSAQLPSCDTAGDHLLLIPAIEALGSAVFPAHDLIFPEFSHDIWMWDLTMAATKKFSVTTPK